MKKTHLLAPGPTPVPEAARLAMAATLIHHRGPGFKAMFSEVSELLRWAHQTDNDVLVLTCSGTGGFEAAMSTFTEPSDTVIAIGGGKFGERWGEMSAAFGMKTVPVDVTWGKAVDVAQVRAALQATGLGVGADDAIVQALVQQVPHFHQRLDAGEIIFPKPGQPNHATEFFAATTSRRQRPAGGLPTGGVGDLDHRDDRCGWIRHETWLLWGGRAPPRSEEKVP